MRTRTRAFPAVTAVTAAAALAATACGASTTPPTQVAPSVPTSSATTTTTTTRTTPKPTLPPPPPQPTLRLTRTAVPTRYAADLTITPSSPTFDGSVDIDLTLSAPTTGIWMNADQIDVAGATVTFAGVTSPARVLHGDESHVGFATDAARVIGPGPAHLHIAYHGKLQGTETQGVFHQKSGDDWYVTTQFEETDARRAFPCFDDPSFKTPWQLTLRIPQGQVAVSNTPIATETTEGGLQVVHFAETQPLPSYLVAFAVGPFEIVDGGKSKSGVPVRIFTFKGRAGEATFTAEITRQVLDVLEDYTGVPYPFGKLDEVPIPKTVSFGAMENAGMVTYVDGLILARKEDDTFDHRKRTVAVTAHELAHQWFGDLVTLSWWNDTWLNESFASWMGAKAVAALEPTWNADLDRVADLSHSLDGDTLSTARAVRQPIESEHDIANAFDNITYGKGSAVLAMFESFLGPDVFRRGIQGYLAAHRFGNATAADFFAAVSAAAGRDVAPMFSSFLDQAGEPIVTVALTCAPGARPRLDLTQKRNLLAGQHADDRLWQIPFCARTDAGRACTLLTERQGSLELPGACPAWVTPDAGATGYYRTVLSPDLTKKLLAHAGKLTLSEKVDLGGDLAALVRNGAAPADEALGALARLAPADEHHLAAITIGLLRPIAADLVSSELRPAFARRVARLFDARARSLGFAPKKGERDADMLLRAEVLRFAVVEGDDQTLQKEALALALRWFDDRQAVHPDLVAPVLAIAAATTPDPERFLEKLREALAKTSEPHERLRMIGTLIEFRDPKVLGKALDMTLAPGFDIRESLRVFSTASNRGDLGPELYDWVKAHHDDLVARIPVVARAGLMRAGAVLCDPEKLKDFESFFGDRASKVLGGPRIYRNTVEMIQSCVAWRDAEMAAVARFLHGT